MNPATTASYLRVASLSVAVFDFVQTLPAVFRLYQDHFISGRFTVSCALLALIQFTSISVMAFSNVGWFAYLTADACLKFWVVPLVFKVSQTMVSQAIIGIRAFSLSRPSTRICWVLLVVYVCACALQWFTALYQGRVADKREDCRTISFNPAMGAWVYYLVAILYDTVMTVTALVYLLRYRSSALSCTVVSRLASMMVSDGIGYLIVLSATNIFNLILYLSYKQLQEIQSAGVSVSYALTWIMSQRLLIHLHGAYTRNCDGLDLPRAMPAPPIPLTPHIAPLKIPRQAHTLHHDIMRARHIGV